MQESKSKGLGGMSAQNKMELGRTRGKENRREVDQDGFGMAAGGKEEKTETRDKMDRRHRSIYVKSI